MTPITGTINKLTPAQQEFLSALHRPYVPASGTKYGSVIEVVEILDDSEVRIFNVHPDGRFFSLSLEQGLGRGWAMRDENNDPLEEAPDWF